MIKNILIGIAVLVFILLNAIFLTSDVEVKVKAPEKVKPGSEFDIEVSVKRGSASGFAKLEFELPDGLTATSVDSKNASFTFSDRKIKLIWMSLPEEEEFTVKFKLALSSAITEQFSFSGNFAYLSDNNKKTFSIAPQIIKIDSGEETIPEEIIAPAQPLAVSCNRAIVEQEVRKREFYVRITISKDNLTGFAKLQEVLPEGFSAEAVTTKGASFSFVDQKVKFVWMKIPEDAEFSVSYLVKVNPGIVGTYFINGDFSYVDEIGETRKCIINTYEINYTTDEAPVADVPEVIPPQEQKPVPQVKEKVQAPAITKTPAPQANGVNYRVQIAAAHKLVKTEYFTKKYGIVNEIYTEMHEGWNKYTIGGYPEYRTARDNREQVKNNHKLDTGPFVTAYNNRQRITVQEALMITNQKWVK
jgi:hypothetical protein